MRHISGNAINVIDHTVSEPVSPAARGASGTTRRLAHLTSVPDGSVVIAGDGFGAGDDAGSTVSLLRERGVRCVIARSFGRRFYRDAINSGLALFTADLVGRVHDNEQVTFDLRKGTIAVGEEQVQAERYPERLARVVEYGGLVIAVKKELGRE